MNYDARNHELKQTVNTLHTTGRPALVSCIKKYTTGQALRVPGG